MLIFASIIKYIIACCISITFITGCATKVSITQKRIKQNYRFYESFVIEKIAVTRYDSTGFPLNYDFIERYIANDFWALADKETAEILTGEVKEKFLSLKNRKDSFDHANVLEDRPGDTIKMKSGTIVYTFPGLKRPIEYFRIQNEMESLKYSIPRKTRKKIRFSKPNKWYRWYLPGKGGSKKNTVEFKTGEWYKTTIHCVYGLLTDGRCTFYFSFDTNGKIRLIRKDRLNDGPF
jgi:hypothetical protein